MPRSEKGSVLVILILIFTSIVLLGIFVVYKTLSTAQQKLTQNSEAVKVALKDEYENPFDANTQYENPFSDYQNPFDELK